MITQIIYLSLRLPFQEIGLKFWQGKGNSDVMFLKQVKDDWGNKLKNKS